MNATANPFDSPKVLGMCLTVLIVECATRTCRTMTGDIPRRGFVAGVAATGLSLGLAGCSSGSAGSTDSPTDSPTEESSSGGEWEQTDTIDMNDELAFAPKKVEVEAGTTVTWKNVGSIGHSVTAYEDDIPDDADYWASGGFDSEQAAKDEGEHHGGRHLRAHVRDEG
jgi:plastocyanin